MVSVQTNDFPQGILACGECMYSDLVDRTDLKLMHLINQEEITTIHNPYLSVWTTSAADSFPPFLSRRTLAHSKLMDSPDSINNAITAATAEVKIMEEKQ